MVKVSKNWEIIIKTDIYVTIFGLNENNANLDKIQQFMLITQYISLYFALGWCCDFMFFS